LSFQENDLLEYKKHSKISISIFKGIDGILYFNSIYSFCHSINYFREKDFIPNSKYYIDIPFLMNKFYFFILTYFYLACSKAQKGWEIILGETLTSIYISLWTVFYNLIRDNLSVTFLVIIQMIPSFFLFTIFIIKKANILFGNTGFLYFLCSLLFCIIFIPLVGFIGCITCDGVCFSKIINKDKDTKECKCICCCCECDILEIKD